VRRLDNVVQRDGFENAAIRKELQDLMDRNAQIFPD
jgi:succinate dehydrogenase/fumarate reductase flavoprotein subunit